MASTKISELPQISQISENDVLVIVDTSDDTTCKCTVAQLIDFINAQTVTG